MPAVKRVGHKGAHHIAPGNSLASFDAALAHGVDMIEFDVLPRADGELVLAHDRRALAGPPVPTLDDGLAHLAATPFDGIELDVDLKAPGYELKVLAALRAHGLVDRALVSTKYPRSLAILRAHEPALSLGWSVPRLNRDPTAVPGAAVPALAVVELMRRTLPGRAAGAVRRGWCDAVMAHWRLVTPALVRALQAVGGEVYVWTVDDARRIAAFEAIGVTGVITNDPRLFDAVG